MLKTNTKKARENVRTYILNHTNFEDGNYTGDKSDFKQVACFIFENFKKECFSTEEDFKYFRTESFAFKHWTGGLPTVFDCGYYLSNAVNDLGGILEETPQERERFTEEQACERLTQLIYRELKEVI